MNTYTLSQLGSGDGFMSFSANPYNGSWNIAHIDNLSVALVPEPGASLLGGIGMLALLRRRR